MFAQEVISAAGNEPAALFFKKPQARLAMEALLAEEEAEAAEAKEEAARGGPARGGKKVCRVPAATPDAHAP